MCYSIFVLSLISYNFFIITPLTYSVFSLIPANKLLSSSPKGIFKIPQELLLCFWSEFVPVRPETSFAYSVIASSHGSRPIDQLMPFLVIGLLVGIVPLEYIFPYVVDIDVVFETVFHCFKLTVSNQELDNRIGCSFEVVVSLVITIAGDLNNRIYYDMTITSHYIRHMYSYYVHHNDLTFSHLWRSWLVGSLV